MSNSTLSVDPRIIPIVRSLKEHSTLNKEKPNHFCINCTKEVNKIEIINECNICLEDKEDLGHFKCGCTFKVCKDCYFNIKKKDNKCPACRGKI